MIKCRLSWLASMSGCIATVALASPGPTLAPDTSDPRAIMEATLTQGSGVQKLRMKMTIRDGAGTREPIVNARSKRFPGGRKSLILIESPPDLRNTGFLSIDYRGGEHADEQWLFLPELKRTTRVPSSGRSDSFIGSDFSYADMTQQDPGDFELKLLERSVSVDNDDCWLIESTPRNETIAEQTGYSKSQIWVSKQKLVPLQIKGWMRKDGKTKYFKATDVRNIDGTWTPHRLQMRTLKGSQLQSETVMEILSVSNDTKEVSDADFTRERLERGL